MIKRLAIHYLPGFVFRSFLIVAYLLDGRAVTFWPIFVLMCAELYFGTVNAFRSYVVASTSAALLTQLGYFLAWLFLPAPGPDFPVIVGSLLLLSMSLDLWALFHLRDSFTYGGPTWIKRVSTGPYAFFPHPMWFARSLVYLALLFSTALQPLSWTWLACLNIALMSNILTWGLELRFMESLQHANDNPASSERPN